MPPYFWACVLVSLVNDFISSTSSEHLWGCCYFAHCKLFTLALAELLVKASHQYSKCSSWFWQCCDLNGLCCFWFLVQPISFSRPFGHCSKGTNYNWGPPSPPVPQFFQLSSKIQIFVSFHSVVHWNGKIHLISFFFFILLIKTRSGLLYEIGWSDCISKSQIILWVTFSRTEHGWCIYHLSAWSNFNLLHNFQWNTFPTKSYLLLYFLQHIQECGIHFLSGWLWFFDK